MAQIDATHNQGTAAILRGILRAIITHPEPEARLRELLNVTSSHLTGVTGGWMLIFNEPNLLVTHQLDVSDVPDPAALEAFAQQAPVDIHVNPEVVGSRSVFSAWLLAQILDDEAQVVGLVGLVFETVPVLTEDTRSLLDGLIEGVTIITRQARSDAHHAKVSRNQSEFMRDVTHDLRSPLTSMKGFASMLESGMVGDLNEQQAHFIDKILAGIIQLTSLVENVQDAGRYDPESGFYEMERTQCDLTEIVDRIVTSHLLPAEKQALTVTKAIADDVPIVNVDANMIERAIINLVDNAIKYTPNGGKVEVSVYREGDEIIISVQDTGLGISPEHQKTLFERNVRIARKEHKKIKGSGLGLFIVRSVAQRHGGKAWVQSAEGEGSTFFIGIPLNAQNSLHGGDVHA